MKSSAPTKKFLIVLDSSDSESEEPSKVKSKNNAPPKASNNKGPQRQSHPASNKQEQYIRYTGPILPRQKGPPKDIYVEDGDWELFPLSPLSHDSPTDPNFPAEEALMDGPPTETQPSAKPRRKVRKAGKAVLPRPPPPKKLRNVIRNVVL